MSDKRGMGKPGIARRSLLQAGLLAPAGALAAQSAPAAAPVVGPAAGLETTGDDRLARDFAAPPAAAKPHTLWHWMDGNVDKAGITADLEAMRRIGLGGAMIYSLSYQFPPGPVRYATAAWRAAIRHAAVEAERLGLQLGMHNASGWSSTGGPWISPDLAMQTVVWGETHLRGRGRLRQKLPRPAVGPYSDYYRDIALLAVPTPAAERAPLETIDAQLVTSLPGDRPRPFVGRTTPLHLKFPTPGSTPQTVTISCASPFTAGTLCLAAVAGHGAVHCVVEVSDDDRNYREVARFVLPRRGMPNLNFAPVTARHFRLSFTGETLDSIPFVISRIDLANGYRLPNWAAKAGFAMLDRFAPSWDETCPPGLGYRRQDIVDISAHLAADDTLDWEAPAGDWTLLRFGYAPNGATSMNPEPEGKGLEVDKMNPAALDAHFAGVLDALLHELGPLAGKSFATLFVDSYEVGPQNWTGAFREEFRRRCGYDLVTWLPALTGRVIEDTTTTERMLWDFRATIAALFLENYYGHFRRRCHEHGMSFAAEPYIGPFGIIDAIDSCDLALGEFWTGKLYPENRAITRRVVAGVQLSGNPVAGAEAFTSRFDIDRFTLDPAALKADGDDQLCEGVTRFYFHRFVHQPWPAGVPNRAPGMTMGPYGLHFDRTQTWWEPGAAWIDTIARCQQMLQQGRPVTDVLCFDGEDGTMSRWQGAALPTLPTGHDYLFLNRRHLLAARVEGGHIVLAGGCRGRLLALPDARHLTLAVLRQLVALVEAGASLVGAPPQHTPSLADDLASADAKTAAKDEMSRLVRRLWDDTDQASRRVGAGTVYRGTIDEALTAMNLPADFSAGTAPWRYKHRHSDDGDIYFVANPTTTASTATCRFRVDGRVPELWYPDSGRIVPAPVFRQTPTGTEVALALEPTESLFVVFRRPDRGDHAVTIAGGLSPAHLAHANNRYVAEIDTAGRYEIVTAAGHVLRAEAAAAPPPRDLSENWKVSFPPGSGAPPAIALTRLASLSQHPAAGVRYFSGTAIYRHGCTVPAHLLTGKYELYLDLGEVANLARLIVNRIDLGVLWRPPFRRAVTAALRPGANLIEVQLTNLWVNRLIGDEQLPDDCSWQAVPDRGMVITAWPSWLRENTPRPSGRKTFSSWKFYSRHDSLVRSGLIGPVRLTAIPRIAFDLYKDKS